MTRHELQQLVQLQLYTLLEQENLDGAKALLEPVEPVITTIVDVLGVFIYFMVARAVLQI